MLKPNKHLATLIVACAFIVILTWTGHDAQARKIYRYTDKNGILHIGNTPPPEGSEYEARTIKVDPSQIIESRKEQHQGVTTIYLKNLWHGPVFVKIDVTNGNNIRTEPEIPTQVVIEGQTEQAALSVHQVDPKQDANFRVSYRVTPGDPAGRHDKTLYQLPFQRGKKFKISQGFGGSASHTEPQAYYAIDLGMDEGTPVLAARDGIVMHVEEDFYGAGTNIEQYGNRANSVRIVHADGTMAVYAHLQLESASVKAGDTVLSGELIGLSGNTGYSTGPHLHFVVQRNTGGELKSIPFK